MRAHDRGFSLKTATLHEMVQETLSFHVGLHICCGIPLWCGTEVHWTPLCRGIVEMSSLASVHEHVMHSNPLHVCFNHTVMNTGTHTTVHKQTVTVPY